MQAQDIRKGFRFGTQKEAISFAASAVRRHGWGLSDTEVWNWLVGLAGGEQNYHRNGINGIQPDTIIGQFARYIVALNDSDDFDEVAKADRLAVEVARQARRELRELGSYARPAGSR
jgi:hypothetical protein